MQVMCGSCHTLVAAPPGSPLVRCGNCNAVLRVAGTVPVHSQMATSFLRGRFAQQSGVAAHMAARQEPENADPAVVASLPRITMDLATRAELGNECPVCAEDWTDGEQVVKLPCNHVFHDGCISKWLNQKNTCPLCRYELPRAPSSSASAAAASGVGRPPAMSVYPMPGAGPAPGGPMHYGGPGGSAQAQAPQSQQQRIHQHQQYQQIGQGSSVRFLEAPDGRPVYAGQILAPGSSRGSRNSASCAIQ